MNRLRQKPPGFSVRSLIFPVTSTRVPRSGVWLACRMFKGAVQEDRSGHIAAHGMDGVPARHSWRLRQTRESLPYDIEASCFRAGMGRVLCLGKRKWMRLPRQPGLPGSVWWSDAQPALALPREQARFLL